MGFHPENISSMLNASRANVGKAIEYLGQESTMKVLREAMETGLTPKNISGKVGFYSNIYKAIEDLGDKKKMKILKKPNKISAPAQNRSSNLNEARAKLSKRVEKSDQKQKR